MTITFVGAGTTATGVNASVTPVAHASTQPGDIVFLFASIRNSGVGVVNDSTFWTWWITGAANAKIYARVWQAGDVIPAVTFTGGVANADTIAQTLTFRGVEESRPTVAMEQLNGSAANIATPALDVPGASHLVLVAAWKQDDASSYSALSGFTSGAFTSVTTGDDASQSFQYRIETTEVDLSSSSITVTGGASAISRVLAVAVRPAATLAVTVQDVYPPRNGIAMSGMTLGDQLKIYREVAGQRTLIRGGDVGTVTDTGLFIVDAELPFGVPMRYVATINGSVEYTSDTTTYTLTGGKVALSDAVTGLSAEVTILAAGAKTATRDAARMRAGGRNLLVSGPITPPEGSYDLYTETQVALEQFKYLMANATSAVVQLRQPGGYFDVDAYLGVDRYDVDRWSQDGSDDRRVITMSYVEVESWDSSLTATGFTYGEVEAFYSGLTYSDAAGDYATYLDAVQGDFS